MPASSPGERQRRYREVRKAMEADGVEALVVCSRGGHSGRLQYLSDIFQWSGRAFLVLTLEGEAVFVSDPFWDQGYARLAGWVRDLRVSSHPGREVASILAERGLERAKMGIAGYSDVLQTQDLDDMRARLPLASVTNADGVVDVVRVVKSPEEIAALQETGEILRSVAKRLEAEMRPGVAERELMADAHRLCRRLGCLAGIALIARIPFESWSPGTSRPIARDDVIVIDLEWAGPSGYWSEYRHVVSFGPPPPKLLSHWDRQLEIFSACVEAMKAGASVDEIIRAKDRVSASGNRVAPDTVLEYTAHGIGLDSLEPPLIPGPSIELREDMVLSVHPTTSFADATNRIPLAPLSAADNVRVTAAGGDRLSAGQDHWVVL